VSRLAFALDQFATARRYTLGLLDQTDPGDWFRQPPGGVSHIAWQVGHLATAEYFLLLQVVRGKRPEDGRIISEDMVTRFGRKSVPDPNPAGNPTPTELRGTLDRVHDQALAELSDMTDADLCLPAPRAHRMFTTKLGAVLWCEQHEMAHAGQIGLLRRLLGHPPIW
jgi:uncharacterized damage-inducible protein DinB